MSARNASRSTAPRIRTSAPVLRGYYAVLIALLYLPIAILVLFSLNANQVLAFPLQGFTLQWYGNALATPAALTAARNSVLVATGSSLVATVAGDDGRHPGRALQLSREAAAGRDLGPAADRPLHRPRRRAAPAVRRARRQPLAVDGRRSPTP